MGNYYIVVGNDYSDPRKFEHLVNAINWFSNEVSSNNFEDNIQFFVTGELIEINDKSYQLFSKEGFEIAVNEDDE
jgi:hypothetical protein